KPDPELSPAVIALIRNLAELGHNYAKRGLVTFQIDWICDPRRTISTSIELANIKKAATRFSRSKRDSTTHSLLLVLARDNGDRLSKSDAGKVAKALARAFTEHTPAAIAKALVVHGNVLPPLANKAAEDATRVRAQSSEPDKSYSVIELNEQTGALRPQHEINDAATAALLTHPGIYTRAGDLASVTG